MRVELFIYINVCIYLHLLYYSYTNNYAWMYILKKVYKEKTRFAFVMLHLTELLTKDCDDEVNSKL